MDSSKIALLGFISGNRGSQRVAFSTQYCANDQQADTTLGDQAFFTGYCQGGLASLHWLDVGYTFTEECNVVAPQDLSVTSQTRQQ